MTMRLASALYEGPVVHQRQRPRRHRLSYRVFSLLLDLDELERLDEGNVLFGYNRRAIVSFWDRDHGDGTDGGLRRWVDTRLTEAGLEPDGGAVRILCYPRILGYAFNPLTVYFCYRRDGALAAILYEVSNTFRERHTYVIAAGPQDDPVIKQSCDKAFYVSPFLPMACRYHFRIVPPGRTVNIAIRQEDGEGVILAASFNGRRKPFSMRSLAGALARYPMMAGKVIVGIHWEALCLWLKRTPVYRHREAELPIGTSVVRSTVTRRETGELA